MLGMDVESTLKSLQASSLHAGSGVKALGGKVQMVKDGYTLCPKVRCLKRTLDLPNETGCALIMVSELSYLYVRAENLKVAYLPFKKLLPVINASEGGLYATGLA